MLHACFHVAVLRVACLWHAPQIKELMSEHVDASCSGGSLAMPWKADLAFSMLVVQKVDLTEGDTSTPGLALLFEDAAFEKLRADSPRVKAARATVRRLRREHAQELAGMSVEVGSADFDELLAQYIEHVAQQLQLDIEKQARHRMEIDALMSLLAERTGDQARLRKSLQRSSAAIRKKAERLQTWLTSNFVEADQLSDTTQRLVTGAAAWDLDGICQGRFPWLEDDMPLEDLNVEQLISRLVMHNRQHRRAVEELRLISGEKELCMRLYDAQQAAITQGMQAMAERAAAATEEWLCTVSSGGFDPLHARTCQERATILVAKVKLLEKQGSLVAAIKAAAVRAFAGSADAALQHGECLPQQVFVGPALDEDSDEESEGEDG